MTDQIMQRADFNVIEVMSEETDGVIDEIQGKVRCKMQVYKSVKQLLDLTVTNSVHFNLIIVRGNEGEN